MSMYENVHYQPTEEELHEAWMAGYLAGYIRCRNRNPYPKDNIFWWEYEAGYKEGQLDS